MEWLPFKFFSDAQQQEAKKNNYQNDLSCNIWICSIKDINLVDESSFSRIIDAVATEAEKERILKFVFMDDRKRGLLSLLLQKATIQQTFPSVFSSFNSYTIRRTRENKPFLSIDSFPESQKDCLGGWNFNVSHHGYFVGIGSCFNHLIGVDIVDVQTRSAFAPSSYQYVQIYQQQLTPYELNYILQDTLSEDQQYHRFFIYWAMKEAYIKAIGQGLGYDLLRVEFHICEKPGIQTDENNHISWEGEAEVWIDGSRRSDWKCLFFPLDSKKELQEDNQSHSRHLMALALGPISEALPSFKEALWGKSLPEIDVSHQEMDSGITPIYLPVSQLLNIIGYSL